MTGTPRNTDNSEEDEPEESPSSEPGATSENEAEPCPHCQRCDDEREHVTAGAPSWEHVPVLSSPLEHAEFPDLVSTHEQHIGDMDGVLARYDFPVPVPCSLKGRHPHQHGVIVRALCGKVLSMGFQCGEKSIVGFKAIRQSVQARVRFQEQRDYLAGFTTSAAHRISLLRPHLRKREALRSQVAGSLSGLFRELSERQKRGAAGREVLRGENRFEIAGLSLFQTARPTASDLRDRLEKFQSTQEEAPPVDGPSASRLAKHAARVTKSIDRAASWLRETEAFVTESNLKVCLSLVVKGEPKIERRGTAFLVVGEDGQMAQLEICAPLEDV